MAYRYKKHWQQHILQILLRLKILTLSCNALNTSHKSTEFNTMDLYVKFEEILFTVYFMMLPLCQTVRYHVE
jgi:hypothetical protein